MTLRAPTLNINEHIEYISSIQTSNDLYIYYEFLTILVFQLEN